MNVNGKVMRPLLAAVLALSLGVGRLRQQRRRRLVLVLGGSSGRRRRLGRQEDQDRPGHGHRRPQRPLVQRGGLQGPEAREVRARRRHPRHHVEEELRLRAEPVVAGAAEVRPRVAIGFLMADAIGEGRQGVPDHELRDHRLLAGGAEGQAEERPAGCCSRRTRPATSSATWPGSTSRTRAASRSSRPSAARRSRRSTTTSPASRRAPRRPTQAQDAQRLLAGLRRPGQVQGARAQPDRRGLAGRLRGRGPVRPRRARRGQGEERAGHRRRRRPGLPRQPRHDVGAQEGRRGGVRHRQGRPRTGRSRPARTRSSTSSPAASASARLTPSGAKYKAKINAVEQQIASGKITDIPDTVK